MKNVNWIARLSEMMKQNDFRYLVCGGMFITMVGAGAGCFWFMVVYPKSFN